MIWKIKIVICLENEGGQMCDVIAVAEPGFAIWENCMKIKNWDERGSVARPNATLPDSQMYWSGYFEFPLVRKSRLL